MQLFETFLRKNPGKVFALLLLLAVPPFFMNLGLVPLFADEPTRANVALEMILTGNYAVPTIGGDYYYNKPPVYNWILAGTYLLAGNFSEFSTRLPAIVPLFFFAITIYLVVAYFLKDKRIALLSAMFSLLNGRMLIYDSMLGHIDIFYSWLTFIGFMSIFYFYERKQWFLLFFISYLITAATFLSKGMPSILFQGFTILTLLIYTRNFKRFVSWQHIVSGLCCVLLVGLYFYNYSRYNNNLEGYLATIWDQSSQRTAANVSFWKSIKHVLLFPFEYLGHLFPATLLVAFCFHRDFLKVLWRNSFLKYCALVFLVNIWVYWLSPETRPRYLLMLFPLLFIIWSHAYYSYRGKQRRLNKAVDRIMVGLALLVTAAIPASLFFKIGDVVPLFEVKIGFLFLLALGVSFLLIRLNDTKIIVFLALLLVARLGFSWLVLPQRAEKGDGKYFRSASTEMGKVSAGQSFFLYQYHPDEPSIPFHHKLIFYIQRARMSPVKFTEEDTVSGYYLTFDRNLKNQDAILIKTYNNNLKLYHVK
jgi:4-amino-4-deoxy-L-arabinose transferase-like glycosyltransferase